MEWSEAVAEAVRVSGTQGGVGDNVGQAGVGQGDDGDAVMGCKDFIGNWEYASLIGKS